MSSKTQFANISVFSHTGDYLPILTAALIVDMAVISMAIGGVIRVKSLNDWYIRFGFLAVVADVLSIVIGVVIARFLYTTFWASAGLSYSILVFLVLTCGVQLVHDVLFAAFFNRVPRGRSQMLDVFKDYAKEAGPAILAADSGMMISTVLLATLLASVSTNTTVVVLIVACYILPYLVYSIHK
jgi:hypothetical protein